MTTLLVPCSPTSAMADVGESWTLRFRTVDEFGYARGDVTPAVAVVLPDGSALVPVAVADTSIGDWVVRIVLAQLGRHTAHVSTVDDALDAAVYASGPTTATGMPTVDDVIRYLGPNMGTWTRTEVGDVLAAERSAQRAKCGERAVYPDDLRSALFRRCARALAMRRLPLAVNFGDADGGTLVLPGRDPEVRRLEAPYRRLVVG